MKKQCTPKYVQILTCMLLFFTVAGCFWQSKPSSVLAAESVPLRESITLPEWRMYFSAESQSAKLRSNYAGNRITGRAKRIYDFLAAEIQKIAVGENTSTQFKLPVTELVEQLQYTQEELGIFLDTKEGQKKALDRFMDRAVITNEAMYQIYYSLLADFPYELYWYNKAAEGSFYLALDGAKTVNDSTHGKCLNVDNAVLTFGFLVDNYYGTQYETNALRIDAASKAVANAQKIVEEAAGLSDYQKLVYYRNKICALTSYNNEAAQTRSPGNLNPWQLVYVFDEDSSTNVVCEGYAKAFQYLCDLTSFADDSVYSYIVTGIMADNSGQGPHMWNIVHMGYNGNYLVDVTNCDQGTFGNDPLFLTGYAYGNIIDGYIFQVSSSQITYRYEENMKSIYSSEDLTLVHGPALKEADVHVHTWEEASSQTVAATCTMPGKRVYVCSKCTKTKEEELPAIGHAYEISYFWSKDDAACTVAFACKNDSSHRMAQHAEDADLEHQSVTLDVKDADGNQKYLLKLDVKDLVVGNALSAYCLDSETGKYRMPNGQATYTVMEDGSIIVALPEHETYELLNATAADTVNKEILNTVVPQKTSAVVKKGKSMKFLLSSGLDMANVKQVVYTSSKKAVASVSSKGKITAKKAGAATVKAKVTLKNGMVKSVSMKIKVK